MNNPLYDRIFALVVASGLLLTGIVYAIMGGTAAIGALAGAMVAVGNWMVIRWLIKKVNQQQSTGGAMVIFGFKTVSIMTLCWILITRVGLDVTGFMVGISALVIGVVAGPMLHTPSSAGDLPATEKN